MCPLLAVASSGQSLIRSVMSTLLRLLELGRVDQVHAHEVGHLARGDALGDLRHHLGVGDVGQVDLAVGLLVFHASTSMSTICLLPPERSHMVRSPELAHDVVAGATVSPGVSGAEHRPPGSSGSSRRPVRAARDGSSSQHSFRSSEARRPLDADDHLWPPGADGTVLPTAYDCTHSFSFRDVRLSPRANMCLLSGHRRNADVRPLWTLTTKIV